MNKEINEMAEIILKASERFYGTTCSKECADNEAIDLYNAGYRKQSDTIKEFAEKTKALINVEKYKKGCSAHMLWAYQAEECVDKIAKEYGVEVENG